MSVRPKKMLFVSMEEFHWCDVLSLSKTKKVNKMLISQWESLGITDLPFLCVQEELSIHVIYQACVLKLMYKNTLE